MSQFTRLSLENREKVEDYINLHPTPLSEFTFTNLFVWRHSRPIWFKEISKTLIFLIDGGKTFPNKKIIFGPPFGPLSLVDIFEQLHDEIAGVVRTSADQADNLGKNDIATYEDRDNFDYVYKVKDLANLRGRHYSKKRNHIKQCLKNYDCLYEEITPENISECSKLLENWCDLRSCAETPSLCGEYEAIKETFAHFDQFSLIGGAIRVNGMIQAFALGEKLTHDTAVWHFEKAMPEYHGLAQLINKWFAEHSLKQFTYVNREQDLGIAGLRQAKESYYPDHMVVKYNTMRNPPPSNIIGCT